MTDIRRPLTEEAFPFPQYAGLVNGHAAYALARVQPLHDTRVVPVRVGPGHQDQTVVYEYRVDVQKHAAVLLRSAWFRPVGSMDGARPLTIQVLVDDTVVLEQKIDEHLRAGYPFPVRACPCNQWVGSLECRCPAHPLAVGPLSWLCRAVALDDQQQAFPEHQYGVFAPNKTLLQIRVVKPGHGPVEFQARCGITAALYSTSTKDIPANDSPKESQP